MTNATERRKPGDNKWRQYLVPLISGGIMAIGGVIYEVHNDNIATKRDVVYLERTLARALRDQERIKADLATLQMVQASESEVNSEFHKEALSGINELIKRSARRGSR